VVAGLVIAWRNDWGNIREIATIALDGIKQLFDVTMQNLQIVFDIFRAAFEGDWYEFGAKIRELFANTWDGIVAILGGIWSRFQPVLVNLWGSIRAWWSGIDWGELGRGIINGIIAGIQGGIASIADAARAAAQAALDAAKGLLGIKSPSRVFAEEVGKPSVQGMLQPFKDARAIEASLANSFGRINLPTMQGSSNRLDIGINVSDATTNLERIIGPAVREIVASEMNRQGRLAAAHIRP
jgi:phage-related protein